VESEKLYSPLEFYLHDPREEERDGEYGVYDLYDERYKVSHEQAFDYKDAIELAIRRDRDRLDKTRGMAQFLNDPALNAKVESMFPSIELYNDALVCVTEVKLFAPLTPEEMAGLKDWWSGQLSDGWGEGFEQRSIDVSRNKELYIVPWTSEDGFYIDTEREFFTRHGAILPTDNPKAPVGHPAQPLTEAKLYSPVFCSLGEYDEEGDYDTSELSQRTAASYLDDIHAAILKERLPEEKERGLMTYYHDADTVEDKVRSLFVDVEIIGGKLWAVAELEITEPLTEDEVDALRDYLSGQYSDGFGEGFEQREIKVDDGELYVHLWQMGDEFFIDTQEQFAKRLGISLAPDALSGLGHIETPAQAALHEPDASEDEKTAELSGLLVDRLDENMAAYFDGIRDSEDSDITAMTSEIAARATAHFYLTVTHNFHTSELTYLLQFTDPLEVVADKFLLAGMDDYSGVMWDIFDRQEALQGDYELASPGTVDGAAKGYVVATDDKSGQYMNGVAHIKPDADGLSSHPGDEGSMKAAAAAEADGVKLIYGMPFVPDGVYPDTPENRNAIANNMEKHRLSLPPQEYLAHALQDRLDENFAEYKAEALRFGKSELFGSAADIAAVSQSYEYFRNEHAFTTGQAEFLLKLQDPLELISDKWCKQIQDISYVVKDIFSDQERVLDGRIYALASDGRADAGKPQRPAVKADEKPSVMEQIRQAAKEARERPADAKDITGRKKSGPEL